MYVKELNDTLLGRFPSLSLQNDRAKGLTAINIAFGAIWRAANWHFRKRIGQLTLIPRYTTGTCSITQYNGTNEAAARTVTFSQALPSYFVGRYFMPANSTIPYKIVSISGTSAYLDTPVSDVTASGVTFQIWKRFYYLKSDVDHVMEGFNFDNGCILNDASLSRLETDYGRQSNEGNPQFMGEFGIDPYDDTVYNTGTISVPVDSNTLTGSSTAFLGNVDSGDILTVSSIEYYIKRVESDTALTLWNKPNPAIPANSSYTIRKNNPVGLQFYRANDNYRVIEYPYFAKPYKFVNENKEIFPLDIDFEKVVLDRAEAILLKDIDKEGKWVSTLQLSQSELEGLILKKDVIKPRSRQFGPSELWRMPGRS